MQLKVNGQSRESGAATLAELIRELGLKPQGVAVAINMDVVPRGAYESAALSDGDEVEIVQAVGGG